MTINTLKQIIENYYLFGNSIKEYIIFLFLFILFFIILRVFRKIILKNIKKIKEVFEKEKIEMAFPTQTLLLKK